LGRLSARNRNELLRHVQQTTLEHPPILRWWIFEGKQYAHLAGHSLQVLTLHSEWRSASCAHSTLHASATVLMVSWIGRGRWREARAE
jgi:hypothetical protein